MLRMAKRRTDKPTDPPPPKRVRKGYNLNVWIDSELGRVVEAMLAGIEPATDKTALVELALRNLAKSQGYWPPPAVEAGPGASVS